MAAPAHHEVRLHAWLHNPGMLEDLKHRIGDTAGGVQVVAQRVADFGADVDDITQHREQVLPDAFHHTPFYQSTGWRVANPQL